MAQACHQSDLSGVEKQTGQCALSGMRIYGISEKGNVCGRFLRRNDEGTAAQQGIFYVSLPTLS